MAAFRMTAASAREKIRGFAAESAGTDRLIWTDHIAERMSARGIDSDAVLRILRKGDIEGEPEPGKKSGDWKIEVTLKMATGRVAGIVCVLTRDNRLVLMTAEWEDHL